jgi:hypothetical protein
MGSGLAVSAKQTVVPASSISRKPMWTAQRLSTVATGVSNRQVVAMLFGGSA